MPGIPEILLRVEVLAELASDIESEDAAEEEPERSPAFKILAAPQLPNSPVKIVPVCKCRPLTDFIFTGRSEAILIKH